MLILRNGVAMLKECFRILKPGGKVRIATPNLSTLMELVSRERTGEQLAYIRWIIDNFLPGTPDYEGSFVVNNAFHDWGHTFLYDYTTLSSALNEAKFVNLTVHQPGQSSISHLQNVESHGIAVGNEAMNSFETMILEAARP